MTKYEVSYYECTFCGFHQTEEPYWLQEAYQIPISRTDTGLLSRNISVANIMEGIIERHFNPQGNFLDFGGGYGVLVRLLRDKGYKFFLEEKYSQNLFADGLEYKNLHESEKFEMISAIEVLEHCHNPMDIMSSLFERTDNILISTELVPNEKLDKEWWYIGSDHGQHISFFTIRTFEYISSQLGANFFSNHRNLHLFTKTDISDPFVKSQVDQQSSFTIVGRIIRRIKHFLFFNI